MPYKSMDACTGSIYSKRRLDSYRSSLRRHKEHIYEIRDSIRLCLGDVIVRRAC